MPPIFLAIVVDRVVAVVRRHVLGETDRSAWAALGRIGLYGLRFALAAPSTATGLRRQVLAMTPLPAAAAIEPPSAEAISFPCPDCSSIYTLPDGSCAGCGFPEPQNDETDPEPEPAESKTARFLRIVEEHHGPFAGY